MPKTSLRRKPIKTPKLDSLPEWNLNDLYPGLDSAELKHALERADAECAAFEQNSLHSSVSLVREW